MYWLVEDDSQFDVLLNSGYKKAFIEVIPSSHTTHPTLNRVSLVYIRPIEASKGYMLGVAHNETMNVLNTRIHEIVDKFEVLYCRDKKEILHYFPSKALYDITPPPHTYILPTTKAHDILYSIHKDEPNVNEFIPIVKHYEVCENIFLELKANINKVDDYGKFYNERVSMVFNAIERVGIQIQKEEFRTHFYDETNTKVYTQYNLKTLTTRPSNTYKGINYGALNQKNGCRKSFVPTNDVFVELDISAFHPTLCCNLVDYRFPDMVDIHTHLAELYNVDYKKSKELTFKQLYGGVFDNYKDIEFFKRIDIYVKELWEEFESEGFITCPISNYVFDKKNLENMNPQKLFNYLLQNLETSTNVCILWDILKILRGKNTKLILYVYDSFLLDVDESEVNVVDEVKTVFKKYKLNIKEKQGYDYDFK